MDPDPNPIPTSADLENELRACTTEVANLAEATEQMEQHINDMMDLQRLRRGQLLLNPRLINLEGLITQCARLMQLKSRVPINVETHMQDVVGFGLVSDETRLSQILVNGLSNAIKSTERGEIRIIAHVSRSKSSRLRLEKAVRTQEARDRRLELLNHQWNGSPTEDDHVEDHDESPEPLEVERKQDSISAKTSTSLSVDFPNVVDETSEETNSAVLTLRIRDTGKGLKGLSNDDLFRPFIAYNPRDDKGNVTEAHSSGLGLSICAFLARCMRGGVSLHDTGNGCEFEFILPIEVRIASATSFDNSSGDHLEAASQSADLSHAETSQPRRLLVVDDDPTNVRLVSRMLRKQGCECEGISEGDIPQQVEDALLGSRTISAESRRPSDSEDAPEPFDAVFLDIRLGPTLSGVDILRSLKRRYNLCIPVIAMTANTSPADVEEYKEAGFSGLVGKPITRSKLEQILSKVQANCDTTLWLQ